LFDEAVLADPKKRQPPWRGDSSGWSSEQSN